MSFDDYKTSDERKITNKKFFKMNTFYDIFRKNIRAVFIPGKNLTIDENVFSFRGRCSHRQYIKSKPTRYGLKYNNIIDTNTANL